MANMSYCRFENTTADFEDCYDALTEAGSIENYIKTKDPSTEEIMAIQELINLAKAMVSNFGNIEGSNNG